MYLKGYRITMATGKIITLPKWDFGGDKSFTNRVWNGIVENIRTLSPDSYPLRIIDLDQAERPLFTITTPAEFEAWLIHDFDVKDYLRPKS